MTRLEQEFFIIFCLEDKKFLGLEFTLEVLDRDTISSDRLTRGKDVIRYKKYSTLTSRYLQIFTSKLIDGFMPFVFHLLIVDWSKPHSLASLKALIPFCLSNFSNFLYILPPFLVE